MAHVPLLAPKLPANAHYFLLNFLCVVRLEFETFTSSVDDLAKQMKEYNLLSDDGYFYSAQLHNMGYRFDLLRNTLLLLSGVVLVAAAWLFVAIAEKLRSCICKPESVRSKSEVSLNNALVRLLLEAYFEVMICAFITLSSPSAAGSIQWLLSLVCALLSLAVFITLVSLFFKNGPYVADTYSDDSLVASFWGRRQLSDSVKRASIEEKTTLTSRAESLTLTNPIKIESENNT